MMLVIHSCNIIIEGYNLNVSECICKIKSSNPVYFNLMLYLNCFGYLFSLLYYLISAETVLVLNPEKDYQILLSRFFNPNGILCSFTNGRTDVEYSFWPSTILY